MSEGWRRIGLSALVILTAAVVPGLGLSPCLAQTPIVVFDEDDPIGTGYYDASWGTYGGTSLLTLAGPNRDKLPIMTCHASSGSQSGLLQWTSGSVAQWKMYVSSPFWRSWDASAYDSLTLTVNGPAAIEAAKLPWIGLESSTHQKSCEVDLATVLPQGLDADPATWQRISIPLTAFQSCGTTFLLSEFGALWFRQGAADDVQRTIWFDEVRLIGKASTVSPVAGRDSRPGNRPR